MHQRVAEEPRRPKLKATLDEILHRSDPNQRFDVIRELSDPKPAFRGHGVDCPLIRKMLRVISKIIEEQFYGSARRYQISIQSDLLVAQHFQYQDE
jgi:hypothetical protein